MERTTGPAGATEPGAERKDQHPEQGTARQRAKETVARLSEQRQQDRSQDRGQEQER
jgi:hypothetical protein